MLGGEGRGEGDRARYDLPCRVSRSELASGARSQESPTKHHAKLGSWGPSDALPTLPTRTLRFPAEKLPDTPAARPTPSCPPGERPMLWSPTATPWRGALGTDGRTKGSRMPLDNGGGLVGKGLSLDG